MHPMTTNACTIETVAERLQLCLPGRVPLDPESTVRIADLGLDSLDTVELLCVISEEFGVRLTESDFHPNQTIRGLLAAVVCNIKN
jgi:acyl carrier protein